MTTDELKSIAVRVNNGSGVLITPLSADYHYVFTANHVIDAVEGDGIHVRFNDVCGQLVGKVANVRDIVRNEAMDAAIIVIDKLEETIPFIGIECNVDGKKDCRHTDYPRCRKDNNDHIECAIHRIIEIKGTVQGGFIEYEYDKQVPKDEIEGASGGGIFDDNYCLIGIHKQSAYKDDKEFLGAAYLIPSQVYVDLLAANNLAPVSRYDLLSFQPFADFLFDFSSNKRKRQMLQGILSDLASVKPELLTANAENLFRDFQEHLGGQRKIDPQHVEREDWVAFGEFLLAMKLLLEICINDDSVDAIVNQYQYAHAGEDIDLYDIRENIDTRLFGRLNPEQKIVVGGIRDQGFDCDVNPGNGRIPNIARAAIADGLDIANGGRDLLHKFTFINAHLFRAALDKYAPMFEKMTDDRLAFYCQKIKEACNGMENV